MLDIISAHGRVVAFTPHPFPYLELKKGARLTRREFLERVRQRLPGIEQHCTHPSEQESTRLDVLTAGLVNPGIISGIRG